MATTKSSTSKPRKTVLIPGKLRSDSTEKPAPVVLKSVDKPEVAAAPMPAAKIGEPVLRKAELVQRVVLASGVKKKYAKPAVEAMLSVLGKALDDGEDMNLQPLGRIMIRRRKELENAQVFNCRVRRKKD